jgi:RNA polymerase sigma factor (sigma-70 family)
MPSDAELPDLIRRLRERDPTAAAELIRRYEPDIRRIARVRLARLGLRHIVNSDDIAQSVFGRFLARIEKDGLEFESADKLLHLLAVIASNRVYTHARREKRMVRPTGNLDDSTPGPLDVADSTPGVENTVAEKEELSWLMGELSPNERELLQQRLAGKEWAELAAEKGVGPDALRKRLRRALDEVAGRIGIE